MQNNVKSNSKVNIINATITHDSDLSIMNEILNIVSDVSKVLSKNDDLYILSFGLDISVYHIRCFYINYV